MKIKIYKIVSIVAVIVFLLYWSLSILWPMPGFKYRNSIQKKIYFPRVLFVSSWKLFTPPYQHDQRLYYIVRNVKKSFIADTIEVLGNISKQKQLKAPFNQKELIVDYLVNKNVVHLPRNRWGDNKKTGKDSSAILASAKMAQAKEMMENNGSYQMHLSSLINFGLVILKEKKINSDGKEMKIVIKQKIMRPFKEMNNTNFIRTETTIFESTYMPLK